MLRFGRLSTFIFLCMSSSLIGCIHSYITQADNLEFLSNSNIVITTADGRVIKFVEGNYRIINRDSSQILSGRGSEYRNPKERIDTQPFQGELHASQIVQVEVAEKRPFYYTGPILLIGGITLGLLVFLIGFHGGGFGG